MPRDMRTTVDGLTEDERRFLDSSTAMKRKREIARQSSEESRDHKPRFPVITMSLIGVLGVAAAIAVFMIFDSFKPYVDAASKFAGDDGTGAFEGSSTMVETAQGLSQLYDHRGTVMMIILVVVVVIEAFIYFFWVARYDAWRKRERIRRRNRRRKAKKAKAQQSAFESRYDRLEKEDGPE